MSHRSTFHTVDISRWLRCHGSISLSLYLLSTAGAVSITNAKSITNEPFAKIFFYSKLLFKLFSFFILNFKEFDQRNKNKKFEKMFLMVKKKHMKKAFFVADFWSPFSWTVNSFRRILNDILIGLFIPKPVVKLRGSSGRLFWAARL